MSYQNQQVNFSQSSDVDILMELGKINSSLYTYPQQSNLSSAKSDTDIWNHINRYIWGKSGNESSPKGNWSADPNAIVPNITKNTNAIKQLEAKVQSNKSEHQYFHDTVKSLGDKILEHSESPHNQGGGGIMSYLPIIAVGGLAAYLLKGKLKL
jgi:hypothetical protein